MALYEQCLLIGCSVTINFARNYSSLFRHKKKNKLVSLSKLLCHPGFGTLDKATGLET